MQTERKMLEMLKMTSDKNVEHLKALENPTGSYQDCRTCRESQKTEKFVKIKLRNL